MRSRVARVELECDPRVGLEYTASANLEYANEQLLTSRSTRIIFLDYYILMIASAMLEYHITREYLNSTRTRTRLLA